MPSNLRWGKMEIAQGRDYTAIGFFRKRISSVPGPQARFQMCDLICKIRGTPSRSRCGSRVPLHKHPIPLYRRQNRLKARDHCRRYRIQRLFLAHNVQINIWLKAEESKNLAKHLPMLTCRKNFQVSKAFVLRLSQLGDHRSKLYCLGPGSQNYSDLFQTGPTLVQ